MVRIVGRKIVILEQVHFATDQDVILPESFPLLDDVARVLLAHPEIVQLLVEGHTDIRASDAYNMDLSQRRAASVMRFLVSRNVAPSRLRAEGFGRRRPLAPNTTEAGMAQNRRVEFTIERLGSVTRPLAGAEGAPSLPGPDAVLPKKNMLPTEVLPKVETERSVLPHAPGPGSKKVLPTIAPAGTPVPIGPQPEKPPVPPQDPPQKPVEPAP
jgi:hypothetical protein